MNRNEAVPKGEILSEFHCFVLLKIVTNTFIAFDLVLIYWH